MASSGMSKPVIIDIKDKNPVDLHVGSVSICGASSWV